MDAERRLPWPSLRGDMVAARAMRCIRSMDALNRILRQHGALIRVAWIALALLLAACNNNTDSGGGNPGY